MFVNSGEACGRLWAMARTRPVVICAITAGAGVSVQCDSPDTTAPTEAPPPLYGTCRQVIYAMNSFIVFTGTDGLTISTLGVSAYCTTYS